jgi:hypothetical protein
MSANLGEVAVFEAHDGELTVDVRLEGDTVWLTQKQMSELFGKSVKTINEHVQNVFYEKELDKRATIRNFRIVRQEGARQVTRDVEHYNLDVIISVGYRVKSQQGTRFRIWATKTLRDHLVKGYTLNQHRLTENRAELEAALELVRKTAISRELTADQGKGLVDVITRYTRTYLLLQQYDEGSLVEPTGTEPGFVLTYEIAKREIGRLRQDLATRNEATALFGRERGDALVALLGNPEQSVFGALPIQPWNPRQHICCISSSKTTRCQTETSAQVPAYSSTSWNKIAHYCVRTERLNSTMLGWPHLHYL